MKLFFSHCLLLVLTIVGSTAFGLDNKTLVGKYELTGVMETAGMLVLTGKQKYFAGFSYGAADWVEEGDWKIEGNEVVLSGGHFKAMNHPKIPLYLPTGIRFQYHAGKLTSGDSPRKLVFLDPNKSRSSEGKMRVKGRVTKLDSEDLVVESGGECLTFRAGSLSEAVLKKVKGKQGKSIDVEVPFSAMVSGGSCL